MDASEIAVALQELGAATLGESGALAMPAGGGGGGAGLSGPVHAR